MGPSLLNNMLGKQCNFQPGFNVRPGQLFSAFVTLSVNQHTFENYIICVKTLNTLSIISGHKIKNKLSEIEFSGSKDF